MSQITTHILDTHSGNPAEAVPVSIYRKEANDGWQILKQAETDKDGRVSDFFADNLTLDAGIYRLKLETCVYFDKLDQQSFYPYVDVVFEIDDSGRHYHVPLLISAFGYSTYRGS